MGIQDFSRALLGRNDNFLLIACPSQEGNLFLGNWQLVLLFCILHLVSCFLPFFILINPAINKGDNAVGAVHHFSVVCGKDKRHLVFLVQFFH